MYRVENVTYILSISKSRCNVLRAGKSHTQGISRQKSKMLYLNNFSITKSDVPYEMSEKRREESTE